MPEPELTPVVDTVGLEPSPVTSAAKHTGNELVPPQVVTSDALEVMFLASPSATQMPVTVPGWKTVDHVPPPGLSENDCVPQEVDEPHDDVPQVPTAAIRLFPVVVLPLKVAVVDVP